MYLHINSTYIRIYILTIPIYIFRKLPTHATPIYKKTRADKEHCTPDRSKSTTSQPAAPHRSISSPIERRPVLETPRVKSEAIF